MSLAHHVGKVPSRDPGAGQPALLSRLRERRNAVRSVFGPHICGDAVDINLDGTTILTGSWRVDKQIQLWDFGSGKLIDTVPWRSGVSLSEPCAIYAAQFSKEAGSNAMIVAGGSSSTRCLGGR